jgi:hypothetical protein
VNRLSPRLWIPLSRAIIGLAIIGLAVIGLAVAGCADVADIEHTVSAGGVLTHKGQPLANYSVILQPVEGARGATGETDDQGHFVLGTNGEADGAPPGKHRVAIAYLGPPGSRPNGQTNFTTPQPKVKLAPKYGSPETSGLMVDVPASGSADLKIEVP